MAENNRAGVSQIWCHNTFEGNFNQMPTDFQNGFTIKLSSKFVKKSLLKTPPQFNHVIAIACGRQHLLTHSGQLAGVLHQSVYSETQYAIEITGNYYVKTIKLLSKICIFSYTSLCISVFLIFSVMHCWSLQVQQK